MAKGLSIQMTGMAATLKNVKALALTPAEMQRMLYVAGQEQVNRIKEALTVKNVDLMGEPFNPPSRRAMRENGQTLVDTGAMVGAVMVTKVDDKRAEVAVGAPREAEKAFKHQFGKGTVKRPWFGWREGDKEAVLKVINEFVAKLRKDKSK